MELALRSSDVTKVYRLGRGRTVQALQGVSLELEAGSTLGIVGESGCGKSTLARLLVGLERPSSGRIELFGHAITEIARPDLARRVQLVFQDPFSSLDPRLTVGSALGEVLAVHQLASRGEARRRRVEELLALVALDRRFREFYPHELSGGQAQRVAIARALAVEPMALVLDEPTSALDVSVRAEVINLLIRLQETLSLSYVFISHDLATVRHVADTIVVMYLGRVVEEGRYDDVFERPLHPYTRALAAAAPVDPRHRRHRDTTLVVEHTAAPGSELEARGCPYRPRCPLAEEVCERSRPELLPEAGHRAACHVMARELSGHSDQPQSTEEPSRS